jgi:predicted transcriptional regulator
MGRENGGGPHEGPVPPGMENVVLRHPVPMNCAVDAVELPDGKRYLMLSFNTPTHEASYFIPDEWAVDYAMDVQAKAAQVKSGLIVPPKGIIRPDGGS